MKPLPVITVDSLPAIEAEIEESAERLKHLRKLVRDFVPALTPATYVDPLATIRAELAEGADLLRPHYPNADEDELRDRATSLLRDRYAKGRWPTDEEIKAKKPKVTTKKAGADVIDWGEWYARDRR